ncbi:hypothetical protein [Bacillus massilinigeriensis]|uniref:hypothetical protein n=1 Tax=Bacillus mediterraneensis TaxID=1805474 RepID=UPI0013566CB8|nr:hypothetical protein [Bacillus mediterraneensis]
MEHYQGKMGFDQDQFYDMMRKVYETGTSDNNITFDRVMEELESGLRNIMNDNE